MKIHYFQRYHEKENVATANTMLLLSRLYSYSSDKFFRFLKSEYFSDSFNPEIVFTLQEIFAHWLLILHQRSWNMRWYLMNFKIQ